MAEDDGNPYRHFPQKSLPPEPVWNEGNEHGQLHPSPQTIREIEARFAEKVKEKMEECWGEDIHKLLTSQRVIDIIDHTLLQDGGD